MTDTTNPGTDHKTATKSPRASFISCWFCNQQTDRGLCIWCGSDTETSPDVRGKFVASDPFVRLQRRFSPRLANISHSVRLPYIRWSPWEHVVLLSSLAKWTLLASIVGVLAGSASAVFLGSLGLATAFRVAHPWLLFLLPVCGLAVGYVYHKWGRSIEAGNNLILEHIHEPAGGGVPLLMALFILVATVLSHLFGASAGREGTALQMGGSLAAWISRRLRLRPEDTRLMLMAGMSAGFGAVFGVPLAGAIFGMEVQSVGRIRYNGILPCLVG